MSLHPVWPVLAVALGCLAWSGWAARTERGRWWRRPGARQAAIAALVALMALRPVAGQTQVEARAGNVDLLILLDRTTSMAAEDHDGNGRRIEGARADVHTLVDAFAGARFSLISFGAQPTLELPFTTDGTAVTSLVDVIQPERSYYSAGSSIDAALPLAEHLLQQNRSQYPGRQTWIVYLGDGEQTSARPVASFASLTADGGAVLGYGTTSGGRMKMAPDSDSYVYDKTSHADALSRIDEPALQAIASQLGVDYRHRTAPGDLDLEPGRSLGSVLGGPATGGRQLYWVAAIAVLPLLGWELWAAATRFRTVRRQWRSDHGS